MKKVSNVCTLVFMDSLAIIVTAILGGITLIKSLASFNIAAVFSMSLVMPIVLLVMYAVLDTRIMTQSTKFVLSEGKSVNEVRRIRKELRDKTQSSNIYSVLVIFVCSILSVSLFKSNLIESSINFALLVILAVTHMYFMSKY